MSDRPFPERNNDRRVGAWLLLGLLLLFGGLYVAGYLVTGDKAPRRTSVAGVAIGGLSPAAAEAKLSEGLAGPASEPIVVSAEGRRYRIDPADAGLSIDFTQSVAQAGGARSWDPDHMWDFVAGGRSYAAVVVVDDEALGSTLTRLARGIDRPAMEGGVSFSNGRARAQLPQTGLEVDQDAAAEDVVEAFLNETDVVPLPVSEVSPEITDHEVRVAMNRFANPAVSASVFIELGGRSVIVRPALYSRALSMENKDGSLVPVLDKSALTKIIEPAMRTVSRKPRDATVRLVAGEPKVVPGRAGITFAPKQITDRFLSLVTQRGRNRTLTLKPVVNKPEFTVAQARRLRINEVVSSFSTFYPHEDYRNTNLGRAADLINETVLRPGETFSLNDTVGERTAANGFTEGFIISDGVFEEDLGGGVSQVATTTFNAAFFAGLEDVEHKTHSFYIDRYPLGREATVAWGAVDLQFTNDTPYGILIEAGITPSTPSSTGEMSVRMWSTKYWRIKAAVSDRYEHTDPETRYIEGDECVANSGYGGFDVDVFRSFYKAGSRDLVRKETMHTTYTPSDTVICRRDPDA